MDKKELVIVTAKELMLKAMDSPATLKLNLQGGDQAIADLGERFKTLTQKVSEALTSLKVS